MRHMLSVLAGLGLGWASLAQAQVGISVDAAADQHPIDPRIYGIHFGGAASLNDLNATLNRYGGNSSGRYNWQQNVDNRGSDYFFESIPYPSATPGELGDSFIDQSKTGGAEPFLTIPMVDWIAKTDAGRNTLWSFSVAQYGPQCSSDGDAGDGLHVDCATRVVGNDPNDASTPNSSAIQAGWFQHVVNTWGPASTTGLKYWGYDNEPSIWFQAYWDVVPTGKHDTEVLANMIDYGSALKAVDPGVTVLGPEEWGWDAIFYSGFDQQANAACDYCGNTPDHDARGDYIAYLLDQLRLYEINNGTRLLDVASVHFYPQGTEYYPDSNASDVPTQLLRNRSTRGLWDPNYLNESYINDYVQLIPRMQALVAAHYPGLPVGLTEYNWGGDFIMNGATVQADILGILGREGADIAIRWDTNGFTPAMPPYHAFKIFRNYDGAKSVFGDTSVRATVPDPDSVAAFAATRSSDGALTVVVIDKSLAGSPAASIQVSIAGFAPGPSAQAWQLAGTGTSIAHLADVAVAGGVLSTSVPSPSVTLFVVPVASGPLPTLSIADASIPEGDVGATNLLFPVTLSSASASPVTVAYATSDGTATAADNDYVPTSGTLTIPAGATTAQIPVQVVGDTTIEADETFSVTLSAPNGATLADGQAVGTILNDDVTGPSLSLAGASVPEASGTAVFVVTADAPAPAPILVSYATSDGTAAAGFDYVAATGTATIPFGSSTTGIPVTIVDDGLDEPDETFQVALTGASGGTVTAGVAQGLILDDDGGALRLPELNHGAELRRDFHLASEDLYRITQQPCSSYEALLDGLFGDVTPIGLERLGPDYATVSSSLPAGSGASRSLRFENASTQPVSTQLVRVRSGSCVDTCTTDDGYRLRLYDTSYRIPRFNNSSSQVTLLLLRNEGDVAVSGHVWAWGPGGVLVGSQAFGIPAKGTYTLNTQGIAPGASGALTVSSDGAYGQLSGKAVAVEPATGFAFDTALLPRPR